MYILRNGTTYEPKAEFVGKEVAIYIDSSKTNSAMWVDDKYGQKLADFEFRGQPEDDIFVQCKWIRESCKSIFQGAIVILGGIEDIITKKSDSEHYGKGMEIHKSRLKITAVFCSFISYFQDNHNYMLELINNNTWKSAVLPEDYRTRQHKKGSKDYLTDIGHSLAMRTDDITDVYCIREYMKRKHNIKSNIRIADDTETTTARFVLSIHDMSMDLNGLREFDNNETVVIRDKVAFMLNRLKIGEYGYVVVNTCELTPEHIYKYCQGNFKKQVDKVKLLVRRVK